MYNYMDFFSNKYKVRKQIAENLKQKSSLKEINYILNSMLTKNEIKDKNQGKLFTNFKENFNLSGIIKADYGTNAPSFFDMALKGKSSNTVLDGQRREAMKEINEWAEKVPLSGDNLTNDDLYEIEIYKGIKNDPMFKHYLRNHLAFYAETANDMMSSLPYTPRGMKKGDKVRYERIKPIIKNSPTDIKEQALESLKNKKNIAKEKNSESIATNQNSSLDKAQEIELGKQKIQEPIYTGYGKRKKSVAKAEVKKGSGIITINGKPSYVYETFSPVRAKYILPLVLTNTAAEIDVNLTIYGGGFNGQADAAIPAISNAMIKMNPQWRQLFANALFLKHDPRNVEPKKFGRIKARKGYVYNRR
jgi:small subunit ribosomal protein S9